MNNDCVLSAEDIGGFIAQQDGFFACTSADVNENGLCDAGDIGFFLAMQNGFLPGLGPGASCACSTP